MLHDFDNFKNLTRIDHAGHRPGWRFRAVRGSLTFQEIFHDEDHGGDREKSLEAALKHRDHVLKDLPKPWISQLPKGECGVSKVTRVWNGRSYEYYRVRVPVGAQAEYGHFVDFSLRKYKKRSEALAAARAFRLTVVALTAREFNGRKTRPHVKPIHN